MHAASHRNKPIPSSNPSLHARKTRGLLPLFLTPAPIHTVQQGAFLPPRQETWWDQCVAWIRYWSIQTRWDIERSLARRFRRRWGN